MIFIHILYKSLCFRNDAHPGYEFHLYLVCGMMGYNILQLIGFDVCWFNCAIFVTYRLELCKQLCLQIGNVHENDSQQMDHVLKAIQLHADCYKLDRY